MAWMNDILVRLVGVEGLVELKEFSFLKVTKLGIGFVALNERLVSIGIVFGVDRL